MDINTDKIKIIYDELIQNVKDDDKEELYKRAAKMAISMGISRQQWEDDWKRMEKMENLLLEELEQGMQQEEDMDQKVLSAQKRILDIYLPENDENAQKEFLKKILINLEVDEREIQNLTVEQLRERLIQESNEWSQDYFLRRLVDMCREEAKANENQDGIEDIDPEAWCIAGYLAVPELREYPEILGGASGCMRLCKVLKFALVISEVIAEIIAFAFSIVFLVGVVGSIMEPFMSGITPIFFLGVKIMLIGLGGVVLGMLISWLNEYLYEKVESIEDANRWVWKNSSTLYLDNNGNQVKVKTD